MRKYFFLALVFQCLLGFAQGSLSDSKKTPKQLVKLVKRSKVYLVDVRTPEEFSSGHLKYAVNINFKSPNFKTELNKLDKSKPVYLYCRSGNRSGKSVDTLKSLGFSYPINIGGLANLTIAGLSLD